jgi:lanosterol synthase
MVSQTHPDRLLEARVERAIRRGLQHLAATQNDLGSWNGDYGGPMFLLPGYVALMHVTGREIPAGRRARMIEHVTSVLQADGSVGIHAEGDPSLFTTTLNYVALRLLGVPADDPRAVRMRGFIHDHGTALAVAPWGKHTLALLDLCPYEGLDPVLPELWLLPRALPLHPGRFWCHTRQVYLPLAYLYGIRAVAPADDLCRALRTELYDRPWAEIDFRGSRGRVAAIDAFAPQTRLLRGVFAALRGLEAVTPAAIREQALAEVARHIDYEDDVTSDIDIGPVNAVLNAFCQWFRDPQGERFQRHLAVIDGYLWEGPDGLSMQGYNSSELWDTAFTVQAVLASPVGQEFRPLLDRAHDFIRDNQILEDVPERERFHRDPSRGGWPFSNRAHGWPITDCTAEGFKCAVRLASETARPVPEPLLEDAVRLILGWQNDDGGWATYERRRAGPWLEALNPAAVFGRIMVDYSYVECTSACLQALALAQRRFPGRFEVEVREALRRGAEHLRDRQRPDGSWEGAWAVCFTYGTWFGVSGLLAAGASTRDSALLRASRFLLAHQRQDGGWGEDARSCREGRWIDHAETQSVNTAWALLTLVRAGCTDHGALRRAVEWLVAHQAAEGCWPRQAILGVFNQTTAITYDNYRRYFPVWALGEWLVSRS